ncbi:DinB family protein [Paenibacillus sedimenti]|uniref:DinB family protein n=1 Tax=Paenibacillus sedimenti TaxID=2770274 RepID=A0A926KMM3_9BACL|nr:DinB family protein [Paenibacillus sedimenti]MBD0380475.1 DinB family protein [Paenibacillus sedimenti]
MYTSLQSFIDEYTYEAEGTQKLLDLLTDASLEQEVLPGYRTLGRLAWHTVTTVPDMLHRTGLQFDAPYAYSEPPASAAEIAATYRTAVQSMLEAIRTQWTDETLQLEVNLFGEPWKNGFTLSAFLMHEVHHRGQMTVLMRQAGLTIPGIFGPAKEEWAAMGMEAPVV